MKCKFLVLSLFVAACSDGGQVPSEPEAGAAAVECSQDTVTEQACILKSALSALDELAETAAWSEAAIELALAYVAMDENTQAIELVDRAVQKQAATGDITKTLVLKTSAAKAYVDAGAMLKAEALMRSALVTAGELEENAKKWDVIGKITSALAASGAVEDALAIASDMPATDYATSAYKARTFREISATVAKKGDIDSAREILARITMGLPYYRATARTDIAMIAAKAGGNEAIEPLLDEASTLARTFENGYFVAGALREVGEVYAYMGDEATAMRYFGEALIAAKTAPSKQEQARAMSRVSTGMSDHGFIEAAQLALTDALAIAQDIGKENLKHWSMYEIVGAMGFAGDTERARAQLDTIPAIPFGSAKSLNAVTQRDVAWGTARTELSVALDMASAIPTARERVQAYSRIVRLTADPKMAALPRYL